MGYTDRTLTELSTKPLVEVLVEGELSPFEHEALYKTLRKGFTLEPPAYVPFGYGEEDLATRINIIFHHPYTAELFTQHLRENWRELKELIKEVRYRRGRAGAAVNLTFSTDNFQLVFRSGALEELELASAMDQVGHLTGIIGQMIRTEMSPEPFSKVESLYDRRSDRWSDFRATSLASRDRVYAFDESTSRWKPVSFA